MTLRIFFLPHGRRSEYFASVLGAGVERRGWRVGTLAPAASRSAYQFVRDDADMFPLTDFLADALAGIGSDAATASLIAEAEQMIGLPVSRLVLAGERDMGRGFSRPFCYFPERQEAAAALADNTLPARLVGAMFARAAAVLAAFQPSLVLTGNIAGPHHLALAMIARVRGIPVICGRASRILSDRSYWTNDFQMLNSAAAREYERQAGQQVHPDTAAFRYLAAFRDRPRPIAYVAANWRKGAASTWMSRHRSFAGRALLMILHTARGARGSRPKPVWPAVVDYYRTEWLSMRQRRFFSCVEPAELKAMRYVYLALHKEPELALNYQAVAWRNQYETAAKIAAALPFGVRLIVREHRLNRGRRPTRFYADLAALPNTIIADPFDDQFKYIANASVIVTDNGSSGWEGLLLGRPVVTLDRTWYDVLGLARPVYEPARLGEMLVHLVRDPQVPPVDADERLARRVAAEFVTTTPDSGEEGLEANIAVIEAAVEPTKRDVRRGAAE